MQFIKNGPDVPDALIHAHEEGNVVFFCGAGISYAAGLPGFADLVSKIYPLVGDRSNSLEDQALKKKSYDTVLDLLENRIGFHPVRKAVWEILRPDLSLKNAAVFHQALIELSRSRNGNFRLVTTNFDRIFEEIRKSQNFSFPTHSAPLLPVPKKSRWDGLVYLHGLLPEEFDPSDCKKLVYTSGDFGRAYLIERWAARFVSELFRTYTVCFVGYSINDPILRYMMDAIAADQALGEKSPKPYAFADFGYKIGQKEQIADEWHAKHVTPILYEVKRSGSHHILTKTVQKWSQTYRDGIQGKEQIVNEYAFLSPTQSTQEDDFAKRLIWALSDPSGAPAKLFANLNPVPSLDLSLIHI